MEICVNISRISEKIITIEYNQLESSMENLLPFFNNKIPKEIIRMLNE